jgi:hypothetical protein
MRYQTIRKLLFVGPLDDFDTRTDRLYEALLYLHDVTAPDMVATMSEGTVEVTMVIDADDFDCAVRKSMCDLRAALQSIGDFTAGWDQVIRELSHEARPLIDA